MKIWSFNRKSVLTLRTSQGHTENKKKFHSQNECLDLLSKWYKKNSPHKFSIRDKTLHIIYILPGNVLKKKTKTYNSRRRCSHLAVSIFRFENDQLYEPCPQKRVMIELYNYILFHPWSLHNSICYETDSFVPCIDLDSATKGNTPWLLYNCADSYL